MSWNTHDFESISKREGYPLLLTAVVPRPIGWVSSRSEVGVANLAPFSWVNAVCAQPYLVGVSVARRRGRPKDTAANVLETGEFVVNIVGESALEAMVRTSIDHPPEVDEIRESGLTEMASETVRAPRVAESPVHLECRLEKSLVFGEDAVDWLLGRVTRLHVHESVLAEDGRVCAEALRPVCRLGRDEDAVIDEILRVPRPEAP